MTMREEMDAILLQCGTTGVPQVWFRRAEAEAIFQAAYAAGQRAERDADLSAEARSEGFDNVAEYVASLKQSKATYFAERNSARDAYHRHREESEARGKLISIVLGLVGAGPGASVVHAVAAAIRNRKEQG